MGRNAESEKKGSHEMKRRKMVNSIIEKGWKQKRKKESVGNDKSRGENKDHEA